MKVFIDPIYTTPDQADGGILSFYQKPNSIARALARITRQTCWNDIISSVWAAIYDCNDMILCQLVGVPVAVHTAMIKAIKDIRPLIMRKCRQQISLARPSGLAIASPHRTKSFTRMSGDITPVPHSSKNAKMIAPSEFIYLIARQSLFFEALVVITLLCADLLPMGIAINAGFLGVLVFMGLVILFALFVLRRAAIRPARLISGLVHIGKCLAPPSLIALPAALFSAAIFKGSCGSAINAILHCSHLSSIPPSAFIIPFSARGIK